MAQQPINVGTGVETGDGELFRSAWIKVNANFADLDTRLINLDARVGNLGNSASRNVGITPGTVADGGDLANEISRAQAAEGTNATAISTETSRAIAAEAALQTAIGQATTSFSVNYTAQSLSSAQQLQARQNISAVASGDVTTLGNGSTATTQAAGDNTTKVATNAFVTGALTSYAGTVSATYLTQSSAAATYLTQAAAGSTYAPLASPTLTGTPRAPTQAAGNNGTAIATTAYADRAAKAAPYVVAESLGVTGYRQWSDGYVEQWAQVTATTADFTFGFPFVFPNACWGVIASSMYTNDGSTAFVVTADSYTKSSAIIRARILGNGGALTGQANLPIVLRAWGN
jgi:hypothetical protein